MSEMKDNPFELPEVKPDDFGPPADPVHKLVIEEAPLLGTPVVDPTEAQLMQAEYGVLMNKLLNACDGMQPGVAIAASISAAFCVAVDCTKVEHKQVARKYLEGCFADALAQLDNAFSKKAGAENGEGLANDTRSDP
jgi:hypothetical protein